MKKKFLITGAAGFIGYHLTKALLEKGEVVIGIDNINDYYDIRLKLSRLKNIGIENGMPEWYNKVTSRTHSNFKFIRMNLEDNDFLLRLCFEEKFDYIINLAAQAGVRYSIENPSAYVQSNLVGFSNIIEAARITQVKHLIYASSSSVYGLNKKIPFSTSDVVDYPVSLYAATKKANELMAHSYSHLFSIRTTGLRFFTVYGPYGRPDMAYFSFTKKILNGEKIEIFNNGEMERDFTYIDDIVEGIIRLTNLQPNKELLNKTNNNSELNPFYKIYNIGNNHPIKLRQLIDAIENGCGIKANEIYLPMQPGDVIKTYANIDDLIRDTGFKPSTQIEDGIIKFIDWFKEYYKINS